MEAPPAEIKKRAQVKPFEGKIIYCNERGEHEN
jgi:hypothetical protein